MTPPPTPTEKTRTAKAAVRATRFAPGQLQFITSSVYRRRKLFDSHRVRCEFVETLRRLRQETGFLLIGWVLIRRLTDFHLLIKPEPAESTSGLMQELKKRTAQRIVCILSKDQTYPWCRKMLSGLRLPPSLHSDSYYRSC